MVIRDVKTNGFKISSELQHAIDVFEAKCKELIGDFIIEHFYYGERLDMVTVRPALTDFCYGDFNITRNRISFNGHRCSDEYYQLFRKLTYRDECFSDYSEIVL